MELYTILDHGCKVNRYDGETVRAELRRFGLREAAGDEAADLVVLNACAVTDRAVRKGRQALRRLRRDNPGARMLVCGCMTADDRARYAALAPDLLTVPVAERDGLRDRLTALLASASASRAAPGTALDAPAFAGRTRAFLKVEDGCDAHCSFCVIPQIRGSVRSRSRHAIRAEVTALLEQGFKEFVLCGIHLGHYGRDTGDDLCSLVEDLAGLPGNFRLRLSSLEITEVDRRLADLLRDQRKLAPHLHIPLQSGDDGVLQAMRRPYTAARFLERIELLRHAHADLSVTTDVIVGFPGESAAAFARTLEVVAAAPFDDVHVFPFSPRAGTKAATLPDRVPAASQRSRVAELLRAARRLAIGAAERRIGKRARVLVEGRSDRHESVGLCEHYRRVRLPGGLPRSTFIDCVITGRTGDDLVGDLVA